MSFFLIYHFGNWGIFNAKILNHEAIQKLTQQRTIFEEFKLKTCLIPQFYLLPYLRNVPYLKSK